MCVRSPKRRHDHAWVVECDNSLIGHIRLDRVDQRDRRASLAVGIEDRSRIGMGLGTEAIRLLLGYAFNVVRLLRWPRLFGQFFRFDEWSLRRG